MSESIAPTAFVPEAVDLVEHRLGEACAACGEALAGPFCHACGEPRARPENESLGHFLREQFHEVTSADGKMWRTLRALFIPGKLTAEYFAGRRGLYLRPVRLFLVANVAFFLALTLLGANSLFQGQASTYRSNDGWEVERLDTAAATAGVEAEVFDAAFDQRSGTLANSLMVLLVPMFALALGIALVWRRVRAVRHLVFATHYLAVAMAGSITVVFLLVPVQIGLRASGWLPADYWLFYTMDPVLGLVLSVYLLVAVRRAYDLRWTAATVVTTAVIFLAVPAVVAGYRSVLFWLTLWTVDVPA